MSNFAHNTNYTVGISFLGDEIFNAQSVTMPGINFMNIELGGRGGSRALVGGDNISFDTITVDLLIDENLTVYKKIIRYIISKTNTEDSTFNSEEFETWVSIKNDFGIEVMKLDFFGCQLSGIDSFPLSSSSEDEEISVGLSFRFDRFTLSSDDIAPSLQI